MYYHMMSHMWMNYSQQELERRHAAVKAVLRGLGLPGVLAFSWDGVLKSWLLGERIHGYTGAGDILLTDGPSYCVSEEFLHFRMLEPEEDFLSYVSPTNYRAVQKATRFSFAPILAAMEQAGTRRFGIYAPREMNVQTEQYLRKHIPDLEFVDVTRALDEVQMVRSPEELASAQRAAAALQQVFQAIPAIVRPGMLESECRNQILHLPASGLTGDTSFYTTSLVRLTAGKEGAPQVADRPVFPGRALEPGDRVNVRMNYPVENWFLGMTARSFLLAEKAQPETLRKWAVAAEANRLAAAGLKPGATLWEVAGKVNAYLLAQGSREDSSCFLHGISSYMQEKPCLFDETQDAPLRAGMILAVCPSAQFGQEAPFCCGDVYVLTEAGAQRLGALPQELILVPPLS